MGAEEDTFAAPTPVRGSARLVPRARQGSAGPATGRRGGNGPPLLSALPLAAAAFALYGAVGLVRYDTGRAGNYDLGIFSQAARAWSEGSLPGSAIRGLPNLFADHFSPVTAVLGLAWRVWADPRALVLTQALALAVAVLVVGTAAFRRLPVLPAAALTAAAALAKGALAAAVFDVHEIGLGTPLMAGLAVGVLERRRRLTLACALGLLLVKEDLGLTVVAAGLLWWWQARDRRTGLLLAGAGVIGLVVAFAVVLVANPEHTSPYVQFLTGASGNAQGLTVPGAQGARRYEPALVFALAAGLVGLRSPIALLAVPTLAWRAASSNEAYWQTYYHYDVLLVPVAALALLDVLAAEPAPGTSRSVRALRPRLALVALPFAAASAALGAAKAADWPLLDPAAYRLSPRLEAAVALARAVPPGAAVVTEQDLGPPLIGRHDVQMLSTLSAGPARWVLLTDGGSPFGASAAAKASWLASVTARPDVRVLKRGDVLLVELPHPETVQLPR